ncbi:disease resistance protein Roq1-like isoform X1 [Cryptomeria japonica]|uniref:disease resistance protein Roq1-like isoform X1 n=2 Tax=Cryptomeria japonica TaxID=3369 RepID=UPI0027DAA55C|nr:disease resistance protein Roq1-like isoform X1 [Cryptomeria japonica]
MASSSSSHQEIMEHQLERKRWTAASKLYDAFISHRGPDVKETFAKELYELLKDRGCRAFLDRRELQVGDSIPSAIHSAISSSVVQIAIFSKGYADSWWCLDELVLMLHQRDHNGSLFIPVFYDVKPCDLRHIDKGAYTAAFSKYEGKGRHIHKLDGWKKALQSASEVVGFELCSSGDNLCDKIVSCVEKEIKKRAPLHVATYPVGLDELVKDFERRFAESMKIVGIFGLGGSGKTTLAKEVFNRKRSDYNASCFLYDVRESHAKRELHVLQRKLLKDLFKKNEELQHIDEGTQSLKNCLKRAGSDKRFLIILDDIDHFDQLRALLFRDLLSPGSLVIVTTRDQGVLISAEISICYPMKTMSKDHAKELFCSHAFGGKAPTFPCEQLIERFVKFCGGLPLSLKVLGTHVCGRDENYWNLELEKVEYIQPNDVMQSLKISFDGLGLEEKQIFMDIACFFNAKLKDMAITIWKASQWRTAEHAVQRLIEKCLVEVEEKESYTFRWVKGDVFRMHDHLRDLGRQMADEKAVPPRLWRSEHLRSMQQKGFKKILQETNQRCYDHFWDSSLNARIEYFTGNSNNHTGTSTALLWLGVDKARWETVPPWIPVRQLQYLAVLQGLSLWSTSASQINAQDGFQLRWLILRRCGGLRNLPELIQMLSGLEELTILNAPFQLGIEGTSLSKSLGKLRNLKTLTFDEVPSYGELALNNGRGSSRFELNNLEMITFKFVGFSKLVISGEVCPSLKHLEIAAMKELTEVELELVNTLDILIFNYCEDLRTISGFSSLTSLRELFINGCYALREFPSLAPLRRLERLEIAVCDELESIQGVQDLQGLKFLVIQASQHAGVLNFVSGLKRLPSDYTIIAWNAVDEAVSRLNLKLFSDVIGCHEIAEIQNSREYCEKLEEIRNPLTAIIICAFHISPGCAHFLEEFGAHYSELERGFHSDVERIVTLVHTGQRNLKINGPVDSEILGGFMATVNRGEESKALSLFKVIIDHLYQQSMQ